MRISDGTVKQIISLKKRFDSKRKPDPKTGCWLWAGGLDKKGYGRIGFRRRAIKATWVSVYFYNDTPRGSKHVLHKCDNPSCVNPFHLYLGTNDDNVRDKLERRRHAKHGVNQCLSGHKYSEHGFLVNGRNNRTSRRCRICVNKYAREYARKRKLASKTEKV